LACFESNGEFVESHLLSCLARAYTFC